jgi:hypothetical protein
LLLLFIGKTDLDLLGKILIWKAEKPSKVLTGYFQLFAPAGGGKVTS